MANCSEIILADHETGEIVDSGNEIQFIKQYGVGIDCHSKFIQVSVLVKREGSVFEYRQQFNTDWDSVGKARDWVLSVLETCASPPADVSSGLHYVIESTSSYHVIVTMVWQGRPSVINPSIAGATKKKTDILDAKMLAIQDLTGIWRESFIPSKDVIELRVLIGERNNCNRRAGQISNRINSGILKFGFTNGRDGSVTGSQEVREIIENQISDHPNSITGICPEGIPEDVRCVFRRLYEEHDHYKEIVSEYDRRIKDKIYSMEWETANGVIGGREVMKLLCTAPGIGTQTAILWMARIVTPRRFPNEKALAAYCGLDPSLKVSAGKVTSTVKRGGCRDLHSALCQAASRIVKAHSEPFGQWGYNISMQSGRWKKGVSAVARRIAVALYFMTLRNEPFSYDKYRMMNEPDVIDISIEQLAELNPSFKRYIRPMMSNNIKTTKTMIHSFYICELTTIKGLGKKFYGLVRDFIDNQHKYKEMMEAFNAKNS